MRMTNRIVAIALPVLLTSVGAIAQNTLVTYQGEVTDHGTNFTGTGEFKFVLATSTNGQTATATANMGGVSPNEFISSVTVNGGGSGYSSAPAVNASGGGGSGATFEAHVAAGAVTGIEVLTPGSGYTSAPTLAVDPPPTDYLSWWSNDGTSVNGSQPSASVNVGVTNGLYTVLLGNSGLPNMSALPASVFTSQSSLQLLFWFSDGINGFAELNPQPLTPVPYAVALLADLSTSQLTSIGNTNGGSGNFFVGPAGNGFTVGNDNTAVGAVALQYNSTGSDNTANGFQALCINDTGSQNTANGFRALFSNSSGSNNTANGFQALFYNGTGYNNTGDGYDALLSNASGTNNTAIGAYALYSAYDGTDNTASGEKALFLLYGGSGNTADGAGALLNLQSGQNDIALGYVAGYDLIDGTNDIYIGNLGTSSENASIRIGTQGTQTNTVIAGIYGAGIPGGVVVYVNSFGQLGTAPSSSKFKQDIRDMGASSDVLLSLKPVTFEYKPSIDPAGRAQFGLIAEQVEQVDPDLVVHDSEHGIYTVRYEAVNAMLLNEFLKQHRTIEEQSAEIEQLKKDAAQARDLKARLEKLERLFAPGSRATQ